MPTLSPSRKVRYTAADTNALAGAITVLEFMGDFDKGVQAGKYEATISELRAAAGWIQQQRNGKPQPPEAGK